MATSHCMDAILGAVLALLSIVACALGHVIPAKLALNESKFEFDGSIITAGGLDSSNNRLTNAYALDLNSGVWTDLPSLPLGLYAFNLVLRDSSVYAVGGVATTHMVNSTLILDEKMWKTGSDLIYNYGFVLSASLNGTIYALGGNTNVLQAMGCNGAWRRLAPSIYRHNGQNDAIAVLNGKIYVQGIHHQDEVYDPSTNTWTAINMTNQDRYAARIVALNGYIYVIGGANSKNERYDPATGVLEYFEACLFNMVQFAAIATDGEMIYVIGGTIAGKNTNYVQVYRPDLDLWQMMTNYPVPANCMGAVYMKELPTD